MLKRCSICRVEKTTDNFNVDRGTKDGLKTRCKLCRSLGIPTLKQRRKLIATGKLVATTIDNKICHQCCVEKPMVEFLGNRNVCVACHFKTCRKCGLVKPATEFQKQGATCKACKNAGHRLRIRKDPAFRLRKNLSHYIARALADQGKHKGMSFLKAISYSMQELYTHLEKQFEIWMTWENYGPYSSNDWNDVDPSTWTWQLDHIIPHSDLPYSSMEEENFKKCWSLTNLRPLSSKQNLLDGVCKIRHST